MTITIRFILTEYVDQAMAHAVYDKLEDGTFFGRIPPCKGVVAFGATLRECEETLRSTLEDWILVGLKLRHPLPVIASIDLNKRLALRPQREKYLKTQSLLLGW
ncbi:MAG: type II toxin-antitoxin system HicB family antitoxin [Methanophagales archaeon]|nr:type II toxin-antitoxin system HicB family antitoxin [Methanophagales archaeon]